MTVAQRLEWREKAIIANGEAIHQIHLDAATPLEKCVRLAELIQEMIEDAMGILPGGDPEDNTEYDFSKLLRRPKDTD